MYVNDYEPSRIELLIDEIAAIHRGTPRTYKNEGLKFYLTSYSYESAWVSIKNIDTNEPLGRLKIMEDESSEYVFTTTVKDKHVLDILDVSMKGIFQLWQKKEAISRCVFFVELWEEEYRLKDILSEEESYQRIQETYNDWKTGRKTGRE